MAHNIDMSNGRANIAFLGDRNDIWHRMGTGMVDGMSLDQWATAAGLDWTAVKVQALAALTGPTFDHVAPGERFKVVTDRSFLVRSDTTGVLGYVSGEEEAAGYQIVQPRDVLDWFQRYIAVDDRFALDVAGSLDGGKKIWATAKYNGDISVAGESHKARLLMSTTFDGSGSTKNQITMIRAVCENTLRAAHGDKSAMISTRHSTRFDAAKVGKELAQLAQSVATYKAIGDAMARTEFAKDAVSDFFRDCLDIPRDAKRDDISTRKANQFLDLASAYKKSVQEGAPQGSVWAALQAITRYADHDRSVQNGDQTVAVARFNAAQFGSGDALKGKAMNLLLPIVKDKVLLAA